MHKFLRAVGFSECTRKKEEDALLKRMEEDFTTCKSSESYDGEESTELNMVMAPGLGVKIRGRYNEEGDFVREYYYPYLLAETVATTAPCQVQRHTDKEAYSGMCEEYRLGISLIFYLQNGMEYEEYLRNMFEPFKINGVKLAALSNAGRILIPLKKTQEQIEMSKVSTEKRSSLMEAARQGDASAVESLTLEDINLYTNVSKRMAKEDVYSILDSYFMPFGMESDQYSLLGTIVDLNEVYNRWTNEKIYIFKLECNDMYFDVAINAKDLLGEPAVGRRFKGDIWLQGALEFEKI